jgi:hypothetical protein
VPAAAVRTILSDAFRDARIAPETKAELLWRYNHEPTFRDAVLADCKGGIPFFLLDSEEGRRWYCECGLPGYETVRCSSPVFFSNVKWRVPFKWDEDAQYFDPLVLEASRSGEPARLMMALAVAGGCVDIRLLTSLLRHDRDARKMGTLEWLMENDAATKRWLDPRRLLFYAAARWPLADLTAVAEASERKSPGIVASCVDVFGRNLLWYAFAYHRRVPAWSCAATRDSAGKAAATEALLVRLGADPDAPTKWGPSWRQVERVRDERSWEHDVILDGVRVSPGRRADDAGWDARFSEPIRTDGDEHRVRIVQRGTGLASEWAFPAKRFPRIEQAHLRFVLQTRRDDDDTIVIEFQNEPTPDKRDRRIAKVLFRRGPDRLYRFAGPAGRDGSAARTAGH